MGEADVGAVRGRPVEMRVRRNEGFREDGAMERDGCCWGFANEFSGGVVGDCGDMEIWREE